MKGVPLSQKIDLGSLVGLHWLVLTYVLECFTTMSPIDQNTICDG